MTQIRSRYDIYKGLNRQLFRDVFVMIHKLHRSCPEVFCRIGVNSNLK